MESAAVPDFLDTGVVIGHLVMQDVHARAVRQYFADKVIRRHSSERVLAEAKQVLDRSRGVISGFLNEFESRAGSRVRRSPDYARAIQAAAMDYIRSDNLDDRQRAQLLGFVRTRMEELRNALLGQAEALEQLRIQVMMDFSAAGNNLLLFFDAGKGLAALYRPGPFAGRDAWRARLRAIVPNPNDVEVLMDAGQLVAEARFGAIRFVTTDRKDIGDRSGAIRGVIPVLAVLCLN